MTVDWTISLGNILTILGFAGSGLVFVMMMRTDLKVIGARVTNLEGAMRELIQANLTMAEMRGRFQTFDERINIISERVDKYITIMK